MKTGIFQTICFIITLCTPIELMAYKAMERSSKKLPNWIGSAQSGYIITSSTAPTLEEAMQKSLQSVRIQMLESVAQNIEYSTETVVEQLTKGQDVDTNISFVQKGKSTIANLPFISGVAMSKAAESYWEKYEDEDGAVRYSFHLLYPYPTSKYNELKQEFDRQDKNMENIVYKLEGNRDNVSSMASIYAALDSLDMACDYFFDRNRKFRAENVKKTYESILDSIHIQSKRIAKNEFEFWIMGGGRQLTCEIMPTFKSDCATQIKCRTKENKYILKFSSEDCIDGEDNSITMRLKLPSRTIKYIFEF